MLVFEYYFNPPKTKKVISGQANFIFNSFNFKPNHQYEKKLGFLYVIGFLKNISPQNSRFLNHLAEKIKTEYYQKLTHTADKALQIALKNTNDYLANQAKEGNVDWLGNLSLAVISLIPTKVNEIFFINFTKVGEVKILLFREGQIIDLDEEIVFNGIEPYPLKIFSNLASGKLIEDDILLVTNQTLYQVFLKENILKEIGDKVPLLINSRGGQALETIIRNQKNKLNHLNGLCWFVILNKIKEKQRKETIKKDFWLIHFLKALKNLKFQEVKIYCFKKIKKINYLSQTKWKFLKIIKKTNISKCSPQLKRKIFPILILLLLLLIGYILLK